MDEVKETNIYQAPELKAKVRKRVLWFCAVAIIFVIIFGIFSVKNKYEKATLLCEAGLFGKPIQFTSSEELEHIINIFYAARNSLSYECKWFLWKDGCYCRNKDSAEWNRIIK